MDTLLSVLLYAGLFLGGVVAGLKVIAPRTKTTVDDKLLQYAELVEGILEQLGHPTPKEAANQALAQVTGPGKT